MEQLTVTCRKVKELSVIETNDPALGTLVIDKTNIPSEQQAGTARRLICAGAMTCYAGALSLTLDSRGIAYHEIRLSADVEAGENEKGQFRIQKMTINAVVEIDKADAEKFENVEKVMRGGCPVTSSLHEGFAMEYALKPHFSS